MSVNAAPARVLGVMRLQWPASGPVPTARELHHSIAVNSRGCRPLRYNRLWKPSWTAAFTLAATTTSQQSLSSGSVMMEEKLLFDDLVGPTLACRCGEHTTSVGTRAGAVGAVLLGATTSIRVQTVRALRGIVWCEAVAA